MLLPNLFYFRIAGHDLALTKGNVFPLNRQPDTDTKTYFLCIGVLFSFGDYVLLVLYRLLFVASSHSLVALSLSL